MNQLGWKIRFDNTSPSEANRYAGELREMILDATSNVDVQRQRDNPLTQDFGSTLAIILSAPITATMIQSLANAIGSWLSLHKGNLMFEKENGQITKVSATNFTSSELLKLIEILSEK